MTDNYSQGSPPGRPSICLVTQDAYGAITGGRSGKIGGIEWQTSLLARWLAGRQYNVSLLTWDEGGPPVEIIDGVRVIKIARADAGLKRLRFFHPRWTGLIRAMRLAQADVYYNNASECVTGQIALWCRRNRRSFVFSVSSDGDCEVNLPAMSRGVERALYRYGLSRADARIVQTQTQKAKLKKNFGVDSIVIPMPGADPAPGIALPRPTPPLKRVVWIGRVYKVKRPDRLLEVAAGCPEFQFDMVGPIYAEDYAQEVHQRARQVPNLTVHGPVSRDQVPSFYGNAGCLCCTSDFEGFPNTFLEAWSYGLPVVSTFDPDSVIRKHKLGIVARDVPEMIAAIRCLYESEDRYLEMSRNARQYVWENHRMDAVMPKFEEVFLSLTQNRTAGQRADLRPLTSDL